MHACMHGSLSGLRSDVVAAVGPCVQQLALLVLFADIVPLMGWPACLQLSTSHLFPPPSRHLKLRHNDSHTHRVAAVS